jgi:hypothetical protein
MPSQQPHFLVVVARISHVMNLGDFLMGISSAEIHATPLLFVLAVLEHDFQPLGRLSQTRFIPGTNV